MIIMTLLPLYDNLHKQRDADSETWSRYSFCRPSCTFCCE